MGRVKILTALAIAIAVAVPIAMCFIGAFAPQRREPEAGDEAC
jgi:hypothetical protein